MEAVIEALEKNHKLHIHDELIFKKIDEIMEHNEIIEF